MEMEFESAKKLTQAQVEKACASLGLHVTMKGSSKSLAENIHWHYKMGKQAGVLEITLMLHGYNVIFSCKKNRSGEWVSEAIETLKETLKLSEIKS
jgi:hypothetical protein